MTINIFYFAFKLWLFAEKNAFEIISGQICFRFSFWIIAEDSIQMKLNMFVELVNSGIYFLKK